MLEFIDFLLPYYIIYLCMFSVSYKTYFFICRYQSVYKLCRTIQIHAVHIQIWVVLAGFLGLFVGLIAAGGEGASTQALPYDNLLFPNYLIRAIIYHLSQSISELNCQPERKYVVTLFDEIHVYLSEDLNT